MEVPEHQKSRTVLEYYQNFSGTLVLELFWNCNELICSGTKILELPGNYTGKKINLPTNCKKS